MSNSNDETGTQDRSNASSTATGFVEKFLPLIKSLLLSAGVATAVVAGFFSFNETTFKADHGRQTQLILKLFEYDDRKDSQRVNPIRTLHELAVLDNDQRKNWAKHTRENISALPRFYFSGYIWSIFYPHVRAIKEAYTKLGYYDGEIDDNVDGAFVHATLKLQESTCAGTGGRRACSHTVDGIFGRGTLLLLTAQAAKQNYTVDLSKFQKKK